MELTVKKVDLVDLAKKNDAFARTKTDIVEVLLNNDAQSPCWEKSVKSLQYTEHE